MINFMNNFFTALISSWPVIGFLLIAAAGCALYAYATKDIDS